MTLFNISVVPDHIVPIVSVDIIISQSIPGSRNSYVQKFTYIHYRFLHDKSDIEKQIEGSVGHRTHRAPKTRGTSVSQSENEDFDVEDYDYVSEEYSFTKETVPSSKVVKKAPYYISLTDVPYIGDVNSSYDIKK